MQAQSQPTAKSSKQAPTQPHERFFEIKRLSFLLEAKSPIAHHQESLGNQAIFFRKKVRLPDGSFAHVPYITADTMRHQLRESIAIAYLDAADLLDRAELTEAALRLLFNGGMISGQGGDSSSISLDAYREMTELMPFLGLLGGCARNRSIPGKIEVDDADMVCLETQHRLEDWQREDLKGQAIFSQREYIESTQRVRMDALLDPAKRVLLLPAEQVKIAGQLVSSEKASETGDAIEKSKSKSTMMPRSYEQAITGSLFTWSVTGKLQTVLERDVFYSMVLAFLANARVGGKKGTGNGLLKVLKVGDNPSSARDATMLRPAAQLEAIDTTALVPLVGNMFRAHVAERKDRIKEMLTKVAA